jgi:hypothetical protein
MRTFHDSAHAEELTGTTQSPRPNPDPRRTRPPLGMRHAAPSAQRRQVLGRPGHLHVVLLLSMSRAFSRKNAPKLRVIAVARDPLVDLLGAVVVAQEGGHHLDAVPTLMPRTHAACTHALTHVGSLPHHPPVPSSAAVARWGACFGAMLGASQPTTLSSLLNGIDGSGIERARVRPLGSLVEHLMREVLSGHQVTQKPPRPIRGALSTLSLVSIQKESESSGVNHEQSEAIKGNQWALV